MKKGISPRGVRQGATRCPPKYKGFQADPERVLANAQAIWSESKAGTAR